MAQIPFLGSSRIGSTPVAEPSLCALYPSNGHLLHLSLKEDGPGTFSGGGVPGRHVQALSSSLGAVEERQARPEAPVSNPSGLLTSFGVLP